MPMIPGVVFRSSSVNSVVMLSVERASIAGSRHAASVASARKDQEQRTEQPPTMHAFPQNACRSWLYLRTRKVLGARCELIVVGRLML